MKRRPQRPGQEQAAERVREVARLLADGVRRHRRGELAAAGAAYRRALALDPGQPDALHLAGLAAHQQGAHADALALVRRAIEADPRQAPFHNSQGAVLLALDRPGEAEASFRAALARDPLYPEALNNLGNALQQLGRSEEAVAAYDAAIETSPGYAEALANRGRVLHLLGRPAAAAADLRQALDLRPDWAKALRYLGDALGALGQRTEAEACYRRALEVGPADPETHAALAAMLERAGRLEEALAAADAASARNPGDVRATVTAARTLRRLGRPEEALARLEALDPGAADAEAQAMVEFERGHVLDRLASFEQAYAAFRRANALLAEAPAARAADRGYFPALIARLQQRFTADWVAGWTPAPPADGPPPIFLLGFPRSGTTLLDQVLDAHPGLRTMEEKDALDRVRAEVEHLPGGYPEALARLSAPDISRLRRLYAAELRRHLGEPDGRTVIDKMPLNSIDAGLIHRLFPDARILLALRHPCDVVLSGFMQAMQPNAAMVLFDSLASTARFYADVMALWRRYAEVLPLRVTTVRYEDLTADFEGEVRRMLASLGVPWDDAVLDYARHAAQRAIATPSYHQVVQPIYRRSVGRWRRYAFAFAEVMPVLQASLDAFGYDGGDA